MELKQVWETLKLKWLALRIEAKLLSISQDQLSLMAAVNEREVAIMTKIQQVAQMATDLKGKVDALIALKKQDPADAAAVDTAFDALKAANDAADVALAPEVPAL